MDERKPKGLDDDSSLSPKQRFFIKLLVSIITLIYAIIELMKIIKAT
jgi:hypothetical protein